MQYQFICCPHCSVTVTNLYIDYTSLELILLILNIKVVISWLVIPTTLLARSLLLVTRTSHGTLVSLNELCPTSDSILHVCT